MAKKKPEPKVEEIENTDHIITRAQIQFVANVLLEIPAKHSFKALKIMDDLPEIGKDETKPEG